MNVRIVTYNIHKGIGGVDRRYRLARIAAVLDAYHADIVFLQEVDDGVPRSNGDRQVDVLARDLGFAHQAFQANVVLTRGCYGNAILSRYPLSDIHNLSLNVPLKKPRGALLAACQLPGSPHRLLLLNCHLGLAAFERRVQLRRIVTHLDADRTHHAVAQIVGGDFNEPPRAGGRTLLQPAGFNGVHSRAPTFPAMMPVRKLDHLYFRGPIHAIHSFVGRTAMTRQASDHLPVVVDFSVSAPV